MKEKDATAQAKAFVLYLSVMCLCYMWCAYVTCDVLMLHGFISSTLVHMF